MDFNRLTALPLIKSDSVRRIVNSRLSCRLVTWWALVAQVHLLWVAMRHCHEAMTFPKSPTTVGKDGGLPKPLEPGILCTACQILRQNASRPAAGRPTPKPALSVSFHPQFLPAVISLASPRLFADAPLLSPEFLLSGVRLRAARFGKLAFYSRFKTSFHVFSDHPVVS